MQRFARLAKPAASLAARAARVTPVTAAAPARSFSLFFNPPLYPTHCKEVVQKQYENQRHTPLDYQNKTAMEYIAEVPVIRVDGEVAICDGGDTFAGHPRVYIQLNKSDKSKPEACKYCGLRYEMEHHH